MKKFVSIKGGGTAVDFETAILDGFAEDGGLYVPETLPKISKQQLQQWKNLSYVDLAFEILSLFIDRSIISAAELRQILSTAYAPFTKESIIPLHKLQSRKDTYIMELFHGPTLSFKDVGMAFLVNLVNFFLVRKSQRLTLIVATTGDTGSAAAYFSAGKSNLDAWVLYPKDMITAEQEQQMTHLQHANIHPVSVSNCVDGGDDLDAVISKLYADAEFKESLNLSSVNSINWGRIMMQTVHYFFGYLQVTDNIDEKVNFSVPSGGFGNLCAGAIAREMGLPINNLIAANNKNACLNRIFQQGVFSKAPLANTVSSAIDILIPINFWRYLYFKVDKNSDKIKSWMEQFQATGKVEFDSETVHRYQAGFQACSISDQQTLNLINDIYQREGYLLDPHSAVALQASDTLATTLSKQPSAEKLICLATAHPAKFPDIIRQALECQQLPEAAIHHSIETAKTHCQKVYLCEYKNLQSALMHAMLENWELNVIK